jgi:hypothetical protein
MDERLERFNERLYEKLEGNTEYNHIVTTISNIYGDSNEIDLWYKLIDCYINAAYDLTGAQHID